MFAGLVIGTVVATQKAKKLANRKLLIVRRLSLDGTLTDQELVAVDTVGAGLGERVLVVKEGGSASIAMKVQKPPVNVVIVGIIDEIDLAGLAAFGEVFAPMEPP